MKYMDKNITVTPPSSLDESLVESLVADSLQEAKDSGDYSQAVPTVKNILEVVTSSNSSGMVRGCSDGCGAGGVHP